MPENKTRQIGFRITETGYKLLNELAEEDGLSAAAWIETTVRRIARQRQDYKEDIARQGTKAQFLLKIKTLMKDPNFRAALDQAEANEPLLTDEDRPEWAQGGGNE